MYPMVRPGALPLFVASMVFFHDTSPQTIFLQPLSAAAHLQTSEHFVKLSK